MTSLNVPSPRLEIKRYFLISLSCTFGRGWWTSRTRTPRRSLQGKSSLMFSCQVAKFCQNEEKLMRLCFLKATRIQLRSRESQGVAKLLSLKLGCWKLLWCVCSKLHWINFYSLAPKRKTFIFKISFAQLGRQRGRNQEVQPLVALVSAWSFKKKPRRWRRFRKTNWRTRH